MIKVKARAVFGPKESFKETIIERRDLEAKDILIEIKYCGICHSDIHHFHAEWGVETYPLVPGHEIAGVVTEVGSDVTKYKVGDHVGVGCMVDSCRECVNCKKGEEQFCLKGNIGTYGKIDKYGKKTEGGYSTHIVVTEDFVLKIPDKRFDLGKSMETVYTKIESHYNTKKNKGRICIETIRRIYQKSDQA